MTGELLEPEDDDETFLAWNVMESFPDDTPIGEIKIAISEAIKTLRSTHGEPDWSRLLPGRR